MLDKVYNDISKQRKYMDWNNMLIHLEALYVLDNALTEPDIEFDNDLLRQLYTCSKLSELELSKLIQGV